MAEQTHTFTILVNNNPVQTAAHELSGAEIKSLAGVPADYELFEVRGGSNPVPIPNDQRVKIHEKQEFRAIPAGTFGEADLVASATR